MHCIPAGSGDRIGSLENALVSALTRSKPSWEQVDIGGSLDKLGLLEAYPVKVCVFHVLPASNQRNWLDPLICPPFPHPWGLVQCVVPGLACNFSCEGAGDQGEGTQEGCGGS